VPEERRRFVHVVDARFKGQNHEVQVASAGSATGFARFAEDFAEAHRREYGYDIADRPIEVVNCRVKAVGLVTRPPPRFVAAPARDAQPKTRRQVYFEQGWLDTPVHDRDTLAVGIRLAGPAIVDEMSSTTVVAPGQHLSVSATGNLIVETAA
jgi:N-methylhydantoinase A